MTIDYLKFDGDSHESSAHWFGMTVLFDALLSSTNSNFLLCIFHQKTFPAFEHLRNTEKSPR